MDNNIPIDVELEKYVCEVFGIKKYTPLMERQIRRFVYEEGLTYKSLLLTCKYCFNYAEPPTIPMIDRGLAFIPYHYHEAKEFYLHKRRIIEETKKLAANVTGTRVVTIHTPEASRVPSKMHEIDMSQWVGGEDDESDG